MALTAKVAVDKGCLRLQFPSAISKKVWNVKQKYLALGLPDTSRNRLIAEELVATVNRDIVFDNLDITLEKYKPGTLKETLEQVKPKIPGLLELYTEFIETVMKPKLDTVTFVRKHGGLFLKIVKSCPSVDIVINSKEIFDTVKESTTPTLARSMLDVLYNLMEWCKRRDILKRDTYNPYRDYKQDVPGKSKKVKPKHIREQGLVEDDDYRGYSPEEAEHIIEAFLSKGKVPGLYHSLALFLFLTGCRSNEAVGLEWGDINEDCSIITFCHTFCETTKEEKGLKTEKKGKSKRKFPCGKRLQELLKKMREIQGNPNPKTKVFLNHKGKPIGWQNFYRCWAGHHNEHQDTDGVIETLAKEGKVRYYLKPYSTRHSFITWQLAHGMTVADVAKFVGNTPEMILNHYVSADENARLTFEL
jgi:integrase